MSSIQDRINAMKKGESPAKKTESTALNNAPQTQSIQDRLAKARSDGLKQTGKPASTAPEKEYDLSGEAWTRATASQTKLPSGYTSDQEKELSRLSRLRQDAAVNLDADTMNELDAQMKAIRAEAGKQTFGDRVNDVLTAIGSGSMGAYANAVGFANNAIKDPDYNRRQIARLQESLNTGVLSDGKPITPAMRETILQSIDRMNQEIAEWESDDSTTNRIYRVADRLGEESAKATESAKAGLGSVGGAVVDAAVSMGQSTLDALPAVLTGGAAGMIPFAVRSFGGATQEARQSGADLDTQLLYGTAQAAKEYITEKIFGLTLPQKMMGKAGAGSLDGLIENGIRNAVSRIESELGQKAVGGIATWLASGVTEGAEEAIGDWIENVVINPNFKTFEQDSRTTQQKFEDAFYDFLVGGLSGLMGGVTNLVGYEPGPAKNSSAASPRSPSASVSEQLIAAGATVEEAEKLAPAIESILNGEEISGNKAGAIARNDAAVSILETVTGEQIETDAPLGEVKESIKALASRQEVQEESPAPVDTPVETTPVDAPQIAPAAPADTNTQSTRNLSIIQDFAKDVDKAGSSALTSMYTEGQDPENYIAGMMKAYGAGKNGGDAIPTAILSDMYGITAPQAEAAYLAGQADAGVSTVAESGNTEYTGESKSGYSALAERLGGFNEAVQDGIRWTVEQRDGAYYVRVARAKGTEGYVEDARATAYKAGPFATREEAVADLLSVARNNFYPEKEDVRNGTESVAEVSDEGAVRQAGTGRQDVGGLLDAVPSENVQADARGGDPGSDVAAERGGAGGLSRGTASERTSGVRGSGVHQGTGVQPAD